MLLGPPATNDKGEKEKKNRKTFVYSRHNELHSILRLHVYHTKNPGVKKVNGSEQVGTRYNAIRVI
jgi:hypothetical protein